MHRRNILVSPERKPITKELLLRDIGRHIHAKIRMEL
jgi:hypothetical protein